ncbi:hypothetical protein VTN00DRAFT_8740 [Thermoascus crustaceus]|uniref:uncharacterized protein n=1 Tax=Thermoascus crustaceus TaxID=5088 RepID=UPI0037438C61
MESARDSVRDVSWTMPLRPGRIDRRSGQTRLFALSDRTFSIPASVVSVQTDTDVFLSSIDILDIPYRHLVSAFCPSARPILPFYGVLSRTTDEIAKPHRRALPQARSSTPHRIQYPRVSL